MMMNFVEKQNPSKCHLKCHSEKKAATLHFQIRQTLQDAIKKQGTTIIDFSVNGESGKYANELKIFGRVAGRGTYACQKCQKIYTGY